jgi:hypothetical protein
MLHLLREIQANMDGDILLPSLNPVICLYTSTEPVFIGALVHYPG